MSPVRERDTAALSLFADEMKAAREQRGWSQADLADQIPYSLSTISMVEALHRVPTRDLAGHLDKALGTSVAPAGCTLTKDSASVTPAWLSTAGWVLRLLAWVFAALFIAGFTSAVRKT